MMQRLEFRVLFKYSASSDPSVTRQATRAGARSQLLLFFFYLCLVLVLSVFESGEESPESQPEAQVSAHSAHAFPSIKASLLSGSKGALCLGGITKKSKTIKRYEHPQAPNAKKGHSAVLRAAKTAGCVVCMSVSHLTELPCFF